MRELLGGKGANIAEMTRVLGAELVPAGFTITTEACVAYMRAGRTEPDGLAEQVADGARAARGARRQAARRPGRPAAGLRALRRARVDARDARHDPQPRPQRRVGARGSPRSTGNERFAWDSYRRFVQMFGNVVARRAGRALRGGDPGASSATAGVELDTELDVEALRELTAALPRALQRAVPAGPARAAAPGDPRGLRLLDGRARGRLPPHQPHPRRLGHGGQRPADGVRQQGRRARRPASRSAATR